MNRADYDITNRRGNRVFRTVGYAVLTLCVALQFLILHQIDSVALRTEEWLIIPHVDRAFNGEFDWAGLWKRFGGHRFTGYKLLFILNALYLGLDVRYFQFGGAALWAMACFLVVYHLARKLDFSGGYVPCLAGLAVVATFLSPHAWHLQSQGLTSWRLGNMLGYVIVFILLDRLIYDQPHRTRLMSFLLLAFMIALYTLFFGRGYGQAMLATTAALAGISALIFAVRSKWPDALWLSGVVGVCAVCFVLYRTGGSYHDPSPSPSLLKAIASFNIVELIDHASYLFGNTIVYRVIVPWRSHPESLIIVQLLGYFCMALYLWAFAAFLRGGTYKRTLFPLALMAYSALTAIATYYGRVMTHDLHPGLYHRYMGESGIGLAGAVALLLSYYWRKPPPPAAAPRAIVRQGIVVASTVVLMAFNAVAAHTVYSRVPDVKTYRDETMETLFSNDIEAFRDADLARRAGCKNYHRCKWRKIVDKYHLLPRR